MVIFPSRVQELAAHAVGTLNIGDMSRQSDAGNVKLSCVFSPGTQPRLNYLGLNFIIQNASIMYINRLFLLYSAFLSLVLHKQGIISFRYIP